MENRKTLLVSIVFLILLLAPVALAAKFVYAQQVTLRIITPHWEGIRKEFAAAFKEWYYAKFGVEVNIEYESYGTSDCLKKIEDWYSAHPNEGYWDIFWGGGVDPYLKLKEEGLLYSFSDIHEYSKQVLGYDVLEGIPDNIAGIPMYDKEDYTWFGSALSGFGIMYNKKVLKQLGLPEPKVWEDLTDPKYKGLIASADPRHSGSTHMVYEIILQAYGWEKGWEIIHQIGGNIKTFTEHSSEVPRMVATGEAAIGLVIDFYAWTYIAEYGSDTIGFVFPEGLTVINPDSIAILKNAPNLDVAKAFVVFVLSRQGQALWMLKKGDEVTISLPDGSTEVLKGPKEYTLGRMSVRKDLYELIPKDHIIVPINPFEVTSVLEYNATKGSIRWAVVNDLFGALIVDTHDDLVKAWEAIIKAKEKGVDVSDLIKKFGAVPITEKEAEEYAKKWSDETFRNKKISEWVEFAKNKYSEVVSEVEKAISAPTPVNYYYIIGAVVVIVVIALIAYFLIRRK